MVKDVLVKEMKYRGDINVKNVTPMKHPTTMCVSALNHTKEITKQKNANLSANRTKLSCMEDALTVLRTATTLGIIFVPVKKVIFTRTPFVSKNKLLLVLQDNIFSTINA